MFRLLSNLRYQTVPLVFLVLLFSTANGQDKLVVPQDNEGSLTTDLSPKSNPSSVSPSSLEVLSGFLAAETRVREALNNFAFKRDVLLQTVGPRGEITGEYIRLSEFVFDDHGNRLEKVFHHPPSTIREMRITKEDIQDLADAQLFGVDIADTTKYRLNYAGTESLDSKEYLVINVSPARIPNPHRMRERFFVGRLYLDPTNFQILKVAGTVEPTGKQRFPRFETWRETTNGALTFPTRTEADDVLTFPARSVHYRIKVRYYDYKRFTSKLTVTEIDGPDN